MLLFFFVFCLADLVVVVLAIRLLPDWVGLSIHPFTTTRLLTRMKKKTFSGRFVRVLGDELGWSCGEEILAKRRDILLSSLTISRKSCAWWSGLGWFGRWMMLFCCLTPIRF